MPCFCAQPVLCPLQVSQNQQAASEQRFGEPLVKLQVFENTLPRYGCAVIQAVG